MAYVRRPFTAGRHWSGHLGADWAATARARRGACGIWFTAAPRAFALGPPASPEEEEVRQQIERIFMANVTAPPCPRPVPVKRTPVGWRSAVRCVRVGKREGRGAYEDVIFYGDVFGHKQFHKDGVNTQRPQTTGRRHGPVAAR